MNTCAPMAVSITWAAPASRSSCAGTGRARTLPDYTVPATFVMLAALPLNQSGKRDWHALPLPPQQRQVGAPSKRWRRSGARRCSSTHRRQRVCRHTCWPHCRASGRPKSLHDVSTLTLIDPGNGAPLTERSPLAVSCGLVDGYSQSKWVGDALVTLPDRYRQLTAAESEYPRSDLSASVRFVGPLAPPAGRDDWQVIATTGDYGAVNHALRMGVPLMVAGASEEQPESAARVAWSGAGINPGTGKPGTRALQARASAACNAGIEARWHDMRPLSLVGQAPAGSVPTAGAN